MKKLIEKGIEVILLCLQIIMAAAAGCWFSVKVAVVVLFTCSLAYQDAGFLGVVLTLIALLFSFGFISFLGALLSSFISGILSTISSHFEKRSNFYYGYNRGGKIDKVLACDFDRLTRSFDVRRFIQGEAYAEKMSIKSECLFLSPMECLLRLANLSISLSRCVDENIESDYDKANAEIGFCKTNSVDVLAKFRSNREKKERRYEDVNTCKKYIIDYIKGVFCVPHVRCEHILKDLFLWSGHRVLIMSYTAYFLASVDYLLGIKTELVPFELAFFLGLDLFLIGFIAHLFFECKSALGMAAFRKSVPDEYVECRELNKVSYKKSAIGLVDYLTAQWYRVYGYGIPIPYNILDIFQAFLDLHKEGWRMKIFPFSAERVRQEKADAAARGEEIVIFPDVDEIEARLAEEERKEQRIASIGELN